MVISEVLRSNAFIIHEYGSQFVAREMFDVNFKIYLSCWNV